MSVKGQLAEIVGKDNVLDSPDVLEQYGRDHSLERPGLFTCAVRPRTVAETQKIIQLGNEVKFAVVPQSSGVHFNGCALPKEGGIILDLSQMNRIVEIVEDSIVAHLQVGVTWEQFQSVVGNQGILEHNPATSSRLKVGDYGLVGEGTAGNSELRMFGAPAQFAGYMGQR